MATPSAIEVTVTEEDIANGERWDPQSCAVARALNRCTGEPDQVWTVRLPHSPDGLLCLAEYGRRGWKSYRAIYLPLEVAEWAVAFDRGDPVQPMTFTLGDQS